MLNKIFKLYHKSSKFNTKHRWSCCTSTKTYPSAHQIPIPVHIEEEQVHSRSDQTCNVVQVSNDPVSLSCDVVDQAEGNSMNTVLIDDNKAPTDISMKADRSMYVKIH